MPTDAAGGADAVADAAIGAAVKAMARTRRNGEGQHEGREQQGVEPEVADAVADLGGPTREEAPVAPAMHAPEPFEPVARETRHKAAAEPLLLRRLQPSPLLLQRFQPSRRSAARPCASPRRCSPPAR